MPLETATCCMDAPHSQHGYSDAKGPTRLRLRLRYDSEAASWMPHEFFARRTTIPSGDGRMNTVLLERFLRYARLDTQAVEGATSYPSSAKQLELCRMLVAECREIGLADVGINDFGIVTATVRASPGWRAPAIAGFAHVDTAPEFTAENVRP